MKKGWRVVWVIFRTLILIGLTYPFAEGMQKLEIARTGDRDSWNVLLFFVGWFVFVPAFSFILPAIIKFIKKKKIVPSIILILLSLALMVPLAYGVYLSASIPGLTSSYMRLNLPDGQSVKMPVKCEMDNFPNSYSVSAQNTSEVNDNYSIEVLISQNIDDPVINYPIIKIRIGPYGDPALGFSVDGTGLVKFNADGSGSFSGVYIAFDGSKYASSSYTDGNDFYIDGQEYEFSGNWVCRP